MTRKNGADDLEHSSEVEKLFNTGNEFADDYLNTVAGADVKISSARKYKSSLRKFIDYIDESGISVLNADIGDIKNFLRHQVRMGIAQKTLSSDKTAITNMYKYIQLETDEQSEISVFALREVNINQFNTQNGIQREPLNEGEVQELIEATDDRRDRLMVFFAAETGARNETVREISIEQIDLDDDVIKLETLSR